MSKHDKVFCDKKEISRTLKVFSNLTWEASYGGCQKNGSTFPTVLPAKIDSYNTLLNILTTIENLKTCKGLTNQSFSVLQAITNGVSGTNIGKVEDVVHLDDSGYEHHQNVWRSELCSYFLDPCSLSAICQSCSTLRNKLGVKLVRHNNMVKKDSHSSMSKKNEQHLTRDEITEKEHDQKRRRRNAEKRAEYWKIKVAEEKKMKSLEKNDDDDLTTMFKEIDESQDNNLFPDNPRLSLLWEMQREVISKKSTSIRWHPL